MDLVIRSGTIVTDHDIFQADIGVNDGKIVQIATQINDDSNYEINADGKYVMPGFIDPHVHLRLPMRGTFSSDDFSSGTRAAAAGGVTTIIDFATQMGDQSLLSAIKDRMQEADGRTYIDYAFHGGITNWELVKKELEDVINNGITSFKMFMAYRERGLFSSDAHIGEALALTNSLGGMILVHAEAGELIDHLTQIYHTQENMRELGVMAHVLSRPNISEYEAIQRVITLNEHYGGHLYIVHMSTGKGAEFVKEARLRNQNVIGETCPQYLLFSDEIFQREDGYYYATAPQVKGIPDNQRLWEGLINPDLQVIGTDSCSFLREQKDSWEGDFTNIPLGLPGTELMGPLMFSEGVVKRSMTLNRFVQLVSSNAAKVFGLYPQKGSLQVGTDADIVIFDPLKVKQVDYREMETNCDWNPYQDWKITGFPEMTILRGRVVSENGKCTGEQGYGEYLKRKASGNFL